MSNFEDDEVETATALVPESDGGSAVPDGTVPVVPGLSRLDELVQQYQTFARKSAKATLDLAETVIIAESELNKRDLQEFYRRVGLDRKGSTYRKMRIVGRKKSRFEPFLDRLPPCWTTLAKMGSLQPDQFDRVINDSRFGPKMTGPSVDEILGRVSSKSSKHAKGLRTDCIISFGDLDTAGKRNAHTKLIELSHECGFKCIFSLEIQEELADFDYQGVA
jgi:hypothetical protein